MNTTEVMKISPEEYGEAIDVAIKALISHLAATETSINNSSERSEGKWIVDRYCSECEWDKQEAGYTSGWRENYCPNCGAKMKGRENDDKMYKSKD